MPFAELLVLNLKLISLIIYYSIYTNTHLYRAISIERRRFVQQTNNNHHHRALFEFDHESTDDDDRLR